MLASVAIRFRVAFREPGSSPPPDRFCTDRRPAEELLSSSTHPRTVRRPGLSERRAFERLDRSTARPLEPDDTPTWYEIRDGPRDRASSLERSSRHGSLGSGPVLEQHRL